MIVNLQFDFVGAKALPTGTYAVRNFSVDKSGTLVLSNRGSSTSRLCSFIWMRTILPTNQN